MKGTQGLERKNEKLQTNERKEAKIKAHYIRLYKKESTNEIKKSKTHSNRMQQHSARLRSPGRKQTC